MIPEIGHFALVLALCVALVQGVLPLVGAARGDTRLMALARPAAQGQFVFVALAFGCLAWSFVHNDFSVLNVASNSNSSLPVQYRFAATWGSHEGSMLLWVLMLTLWMSAVSVFSRNLPEAMAARILAVMALVSAGFLAFMLATSNPFERLLPAAEDGRDLNPLLQDPGMVIHPPMLYMGYVGFSVAFSFAIAALLGGQLDQTWARWSRPWTTAAWMFLTIGICLGSAWAYYELGWGGWWFWDPVENASFMPWLVGTALIHSLAVTEKRGGFKIWTVLLAIIAFSLSLLGTFLVRSGVLTSVHAFATDPKRGVFILAFLSIVVGGSLLLFAWRAPKVGLGGKFEPVSRESALLAGNVLLFLAMVFVLMGTLYPLAHEAVTGEKLSVGPPWFELMFPVAMVPAALLLGVGPLAQWKRADWRVVAGAVGWPLVVSAIAAAAIPLAMGRASPMICMAFFLVGWIVSTAVANVAERAGALAKVQGRGRWAALRAQPRGYWGMLLAHCAVAVFITGVTMVNSYETEKDVRMRAGEIVEVGGYTFRLERFERKDGPNYESTMGTFTVLRGGREITTLHPEKRFYPVQQMPMTEADMHSGLTRDLYVALGEPVGDGAWIVRVYHKPFIDWIWGGCFLMAIGGLVAMTDRRYRSARQAARATSAATPAPAVP